MDGDLAVGDFVRWQDGEIPDIGRLLRLGSTCDVGFQVSVDETLQVEIRRRDLRRAESHPGSRVYWRGANGNWHVGTVLVGMGQNIRVRDDQGATLEIAKREATVRVPRPIADATGLLVEGVLSSPAEVSARRAFWKGTAAQHAASAGCAALLSSNVELYDYQLRTVLRVLQDSTRRYLIADEVGLGKTIEAGLIIRQTQLEQPDANVAVAVPEALIDQWCRELADKFGVQASRGAVDVLDWDDSGWESLGATDLLVVDEAHQLAAKPSAASYRRIADRARRTAGVLLLTATPTLRRDTDLLALLHLLDANAYPLDDLERFGARIEERVPIATWLAGFRPEFSGFALRRRISSGRRLFADDRDTVKLLDAAEQALEAGNEHERTDAIRSVRSHVGERHRLHRRILRTRRESDPAAAAAVRGRDDPELAASHPERGPALAALEDWRLYLAARAAAAPATEREALLTLLVLFAARAGSDLSLLERVASARAAGDASALRGAGFSQSAAAALLKIPSDRDERGLLLELADAAASPARHAHAAHLAEAIAPYSEDERIVVFSDFPGVRAAIATALADHLGLERVGLHKMGSREGREVLRAFQRGGAVDLLVCGPAAEQGVDLARADRIVHADLPWLPARLEQRIGRADRLGAGDPVRSLVFVDDLVKPSLPDAWFRCVRDGFGVFRASIADIQLAIVDETSRARHAMLNAGADGLQEVTDALPATLASARESSNELELLDAVSGSDDAQQFVPQFRGADTAAEALEEPTRQMLSVRGGVFSSPGEGLLSLNWRSRGFRPPGPALSRHFDESFAFERAAARREGVRLMRIGDAAFEAIAEWLACEDVGRAAVVRRTVPTVDDEQLFLGFGLLDDPDDARGFSTTGSARSVWVRDDAEVVEDSALLAVLGAPVGAAGDDPLSLFEPWQLEAFVSPADWPDRCAAAARAALAYAFPGRAISEVGDMSGLRIDTVAAIVLQPRP